MSGNKRAWEPGVKLPSVHSPWTGVSEWPRFYRHRVCFVHKWRTPYITLLLTHEQAMALWGRPIVAGVALSVWPTYLDPAFTAVWMADPRDPRRRRSTVTLVARMKEIGGDFSCKFETSEQNRLTRSKALNYSAVATRDEEMGGGTHQRCLFKRQGLMGYALRWRLGDGCISDFDVERERPELTLDSCGAAATAGDPDAVWARTPSDLEDGLMVSVRAYYHQGGFSLAADGSPPPFCLPVTFKYK